MKRWSETRDVLERLAAGVHAGHRAALATLVRVHGSSYRREGAKLLVLEDGGTTGNISAGCLEHDVREVALAVARSGRAALRSYCSGPGQDSVWELGLGCDGQIDVFIEPALDARPVDRRLLADRTPFARCIVIAGDGATPGAHLVVTPSTVDGSLGDAALDAGVAARARALIAEGETALERIAGRELFIEALRPPPRLIVCGAGDDAAPLARLAADMGFEPVVVDHRRTLLTAERFPPPVRLTASDGAGLREHVPLDDECFAVVMSHRLADDVEYVRALLGSAVPYVGLLGPRRRTERILAVLGVEGDACGRVYGPVGLDIGAEGADQVALAVIAEVLAVRAGRRPVPLRERGGPIAGGRILVGATASRS